MDPHMKSDLIFYAFFLAGQMLFLLKRAGSAVRNPKTGIQTRRDYFYNNWDTALIRGIIEFGLIFWPLRHYSIDQITQLFGWSAPAILTGAVSSVVGFLCVGYAADSALDGLSMSPKLPQFLRDWLHENVPPMSAVAPEASNK